MTTKYARATIKTAPTDGSGFVSAYLATWAIDRDKERFAKGAFAASILRWDASGQQPPVLWEHDTETPANVLGSITKMSETDQGLLVEIQLDLTNDTAVSVYERLLAGTLNTMSVGFA